MHATVDHVTTSLLTTVVKARVTCSAMSRHLAEMVRSPVLSLTVTPPTVKYVSCHAALQGATQGHSEGLDLI